MVETGVGVSVPCLDKDATSLAVVTTRPLLLVATTRCLTPCLSLCPSWCLNPLVFPYDIGLSPVTSVSEGVGALVVLPEVEPPSHRSPNLLVDSCL
jgi:hypothetical protein